MAIKKIIKNRVTLAVKCNPIDTESQPTRIKKIVTDLLDTANHHRVPGGGGCIGLAANQIGYNARMFIMRYGGYWMVVINPKVLKFSRREKMAKEGCLSFPNKQINVVRSDQVDITYIDHDGDTITKRLNKLDARVFQHEFDHLNGRVIV